MAEILPPLPAFQERNLEVFLGLSSIMQRSYNCSPVLPSQFSPPLPGNPWTVYFQGLEKHADLTYVFPAHPLGRKQIGKTEL